jgi:AAA+ ATPase superfamily predicted ATPase
MFVSRENELHALQELYNENKFQMIVMYGRRRVGKTTLISEFIKNKPAIFFSAGEANNKMNLAMFSEEVYAFFDIPKVTGAFNNWHDAFMFIAEKAKTQKFILAIDEFPYIAEVNKEVKSILQNIIDHELLDTKLYLILCGSQISFMEREVLGYKSPLFGRRTAQFRVDSFDYYDAAKMLPFATSEDKIKYYACVGGTPHYLAQIDKESTFEENIKKLFFRPRGYLYSEPTMLLQQELREPAMYNSIISAIATGANRLNDIAVKVDEDTAKVMKYINTLVGLKIIQKDIPFGENPERSRKGIYKLSDNCFKFWYRYVFLNKTSIENGLGDEVAENYVFPELSSFSGRHAVEDICKQYIIRRSKERKLPFLALNFGTWWGNDPETKTNADIDIVADNKHEKKVILCECKWKNEKTDVNEIKKLMEKSRLLPGYNEYHYMFFSRAEYTENALLLAQENDNLQLVTMDMLFLPIHPPSIS